MICDFTIRPLNAETQAAMGSKCYVDGVEAKLVFYADTEAGVVRTYDVAGDGIAHAFRERAWSPEVLDFDGKAVRELRGKVEIRRD